MDQLSDARDVVRAARSIAVLTGAGVSAESGIPTFRSNGGYWQQHRFEDLATPDAFHRDPNFVWTWYEERRRGIAATKPNPGHYALVEMEKRSPAFTLITQNWMASTTSPDHAISSSSTAISGCSAASAAVAKKRCATNWRRSRRTAIAGACFVPESCGSESRCRKAQSKPLPTRCERVMS